MAALMEMVGPDRQAPPPYINSPSASLADMQLALDLNSSTSPARLTPSASPPRCSLVFQLIAQTLHKKRSVSKPAYIPAAAVSFVFIQAAVNQEQDLFQTVKTRSFEKMLEYETNIYLLG